MDILAVPCLYVITNDESDTIFQVSLAVHTTIKFGKPQVPSSYFASREYRVGDSAFENE